MLKRLNAQLLSSVIGGVLVSVLYASNSMAATRAVVVAGLGGNVEYSQAFVKQAEATVNGLRTLSSLPEHVVTLGLNPGPNADVSGSENVASRDSLLEALDAVVQEANQLAGSADEIDTFVLVMLGHGNVNRDGWQFNLAGPDFSAQDLVAALAPLTVERQVVIASTSASGALLTPLAQPGRTVITATKSGGESNAVRFSQYFAEAMASDVADVDRNELLSVQEAFIYANDLTVRYFEEQKLLASEHARLEGGDATNVTLTTLGALREAKNNPAVAALLDDRAELEKTFYEVKARKHSLSEDAYYRELESVLIAIATLQNSIDSVIGSAVDSVEENKEWVE